MIHSIKQSYTAATSLNIRRLCRVDLESAPAFPRQRPAFQKAFSSYNLFSPAPGKEEKPFKYEEETLRRLSL